MESHKSLMIRLFLFILGLTAMSTQVIMIRETLAIFHGNELIIGLFLGFWMLLTGAGAFLAGQSSKFKVPTSPLLPPLQMDMGPGGKAKDAAPSIITSLLLLLSLLPLYTLFALAYIKANFIPAGVMAGLGQTSLIIFLSLLPFCLVSGMLFPILVKQLSLSKDKNLLHEGYALDSLGSILGGLLFSLVFIFVLSSFESLLILTFTCMIAVVAWERGRKRAWRHGGMGFLVIGLVVMAISFVIKPDKILNSLTFKNQEVLEVKASPFGKLAVTRIDEQLNLYINGVPVVTGDDTEFREESVHYAMLLHPGPKNILLISGGTGGTIGEILKYPIQTLDYLEINPWMIRLIGKYRPFPADTRVSYIYKDPRIFLKKNSKKYDVIILNIPEPNSAEMNRFYTMEFFQLLKDELNTGGIVSLSVPAAGNYMNETSRLMHSVYYNTLQTLFIHVRIIPGGKDYYLASEAPLDHSFFRNYQSLGFTNIYVNPSYISEDLQKKRSDLIMKDIMPEAPVNTDLNPYIFSEFLKHWLSQFRVNYMIIPITLAILTVIGFIFLGPLNLGLFAGGFTASALEFLLLIWFQVLYGFVYQMTGVIFAVFMAGMAIGSFYRAHFYKNSTFRGFLKIQSVFAVFSALLAGLMMFIPSGSADLIIIPLLLVMVFFTGLLMGIQFSLSSQLRKTNILTSSGESFSADLLGSAIGILIVSVYLIPQFGLPMTGVVLAGLNVVALGVIGLKR